MICCSCGKEIDINYGREYWNGIYCKKCADEMLSTPEYIKNYKRIIADLQAENAALRERLEKAGEKVKELKKDIEPAVYVSFVGFVVRWCTLEEHKEIYGTSEAAEARLAELKGEEK